MATTQVQRRRGTDIQNNAFTGAEGEFTYDTVKKTIRVHDGSTVGGFPLVRQGSGVTESTTAVLRKLSWDDQGLITGADTVVWSDLSSVLSGHVVESNALITAGTACKVTYDSKGLITGVSSLIESDIPALSISKITNLQTSLDEKMDKIPVVTFDSPTGNLQLQDGKVHSITPIGAVVLVMPTVTDTTKFHQCMVQLNNTAPYSVAFSDVSVNFGTGTGSPASTLSTAGLYNVYFEYDTPTNRWTVGVIAKTTIS